ncbi:TIR-like protein FxsC [Streptomyces rubellomurinus]|uniref:TIR-like protein FxsC n=1 Tax=Streptomyces rubellomurinus (strain ATCC 31215) TaxID=359131 RepID=UPI000698C793|nr:TIR-like protein FxsC [Streptomyces rubellomurinus]
MERDQRQAQDAGDQPDQRPYFFFSYARRDYVAEDAFVDQFFNDLRDELGRMQPGARADELAYRDTERLRVGDDWAQQLARMLGRCRALVALYSPAYFASDYCGKEWTAFRGRVRRHHEQHGEHVAALIPVLWEPVAPGELHEEVTKIQWAQPDMGEAYARYGLRALLRTDPGGEAYRKIVRVVAGRVKVAADRRLADLQEFDLGAVRGYFPPPQPPTVSTPEPSSSPGMVRLFIAAGRAAEAAAAGGAHYGAKPWDWAPYHPPTRPSLAARAQQVITAAGHTTTLEEIDAGLGEKLDQAREDSQVSVLLVDPWVAGSERYRAALREYDDQNHPVTGVLLPSGDQDPADGPTREALWTGVRGVFRRNWLRRFDPDPLFRVKVGRDSFDRDLDIVVTVAQNKLMDDNFDWGEGGAVFGVGPGDGPQMPGLAIPPRPAPAPPGLPGLSDLSGLPGLPGRRTLDLPYDLPGQRRADQDRNAPSNGDESDDH